LLPAKTNKVYFLPEGDGMLLAHADTGKFVHVFPVFGENLPDYIVVHRSSLAPFFEVGLQQTSLMLPPGAPLPSPFYSRNGTENWYLFPVINNKYPPYILLKGDTLFNKIDN
jgi:hypothetical protein